MLEGGYPSSVKVTVGEVRVVYFHRFVLEVRRGHGDHAHARGWAGGVIRRGGPIERPTLRALATRGADMGIAAQ